MSENFFSRFGTHHPACGRILSNRHQAALDDDAMDNVPKGIEPVHHVVEGARAYAKAKGLADPHEGFDYGKVTTHRDLLKNLAHHYDRLPLNDPSAHKHFAAMRDEVNSQHDFMTKKMGLSVHVTDHDPYKDVHELRHDVDKNRRIQVLGTHVTGSHPFFSDEENDKFRAVHDVFGHLGTGRSFDRHGEEAAFHAHSRMFSHHALPAMTSETRGQNGSLIVNGHFGPQRIAVLPKHLWHPGLAHTSMNQRIAVLLNGGNEKPGFQVYAHVSGNAVNILHCPFCGSGAVIGRSDGTVECGYCTSVFTVQVQPAFNGFPQSVDGQQYPWPGQPAPEDTLAPGTPPGTNLAPGVQPLGGDPAAMGMDGGAPESSDPADGEDVDEDDDKPAFLKGKGDDEKSDKKKGDNPFKKKKSYRTASGAELSEEDFLAHIAILTANDRDRAVAVIKQSRLRGAG